jgi:hypothetical protein
MNRSLTIATVLFFSALALRLSGTIEPEASLVHAQAAPQPPAQTQPPLSGGYAGSDTCVVSDRSGSKPQGHETRAGAESAVAGGGQQLRELPWPRAGAR